MPIHIDHPDSPYRNQPCIVYSADFKRSLRGTIENRIISREDGKTRWYVEFNPMQLPEEQREALNFQSFQMGYCVVEDDNILIMLDEPSGTA